MLLNLGIENVALIEKADVNFGDGFNVLTGETGAGKSILIGSLNMLLGERIGRDIIRSDKKFAYVEGLFYITEQIAEYLKRYDVFPEEDGSLIVSRKLSADGKNICKVGRKMVSVSVLQEIGRSLMNIYGQHDNQALLDTATHIVFLDAFSQDTQELFRSYSNVYSDLKNAEHQLDSLHIDEAEKLRKMDILQFEIDEIKSAAIYPGEEEELKKKRSLARNKEKFTDNCVQVLDLLYENSEGICVYNLLTDIQNRLNSTAETDEELEQTAEKIAEIRYNIEDITAVIRKRLEQVSELDFSLEEMEERLDVLYRLKRKYGSTEEEILKYCEQAEQELISFETSETQKNEIAKEILRLSKEADVIAKKMHLLRVNNAKKVEKYVNAELQELQMEGAVFSVQIKPCSLGKYGTDKIEFLISTNKGEPLKPLTKIVSGGELSRIMLALKHVLTAGDITGTLIFDEIDTGISGRAAGKVGAKLLEISSHKQVLCVTHLPQIAALSHHHFKISKQQVGEKTITQIHLLENEEKTAEIALMIGGNVVTKTTLAQADDMIHRK